MRPQRWLVGASAGFALMIASAASASPWAEVGDSQLRSDIEILAAAHVIDGITTHWPLPWASILRRLRNDPKIDAQPAFVRAAAERVINAAESQLHIGSFKASITVDGTNNPSAVRGFDGMGRETAEGQVSAEYVGSDTAVRLSLGAEVSHRTGRTVFMPDNSYIAQRIGGAVIYGGYLTHWWGPGWVSALSLSNNARPMPQIGITRDSTDAFQSPLLSWLGPWQAEFFVGLLDDNRIAENTVFDGLRFTFNPFPGLEIGLARTQELCGTGHTCKPLAYYFEFSNDASHTNHTNDEGVIDVKYMTEVSGNPVQVYMQLMNEDSSPISHSGTSHLFGASLWLPVGDQPVRLTAEYTSSVATANIFGGGDFYSFAYNNAGYPDGMRYRGRTLGFSLDSDSTLLTLQGAWQTRNGWSYEVTFHHAAIANPHDTLVNPVTTAPVHINLGEARVSIPWRNIHIELAGRLQDDQPRPDHGFQASIEGAFTYNF